MGRLLVTLALLLFVSSAPGQTTLSPEHVIRRIMETGTIEGVDYKMIGELGDATAVAVTRVIAGRNVSKIEAGNVLIILKRAFADPRTVPIKSDREPRTTLFVLSWLESRADSELKVRILETRKYVQDQAEKAKDQSKPPPKVYPSERWPGLAGRMGA